MKQCEARRRWAESLAAQIENVVQPNPGDFFFYLNLLLIGNEHHLS